MEISPETTTFGARRVATAIPSAFAFSRILHLGFLCLAALSSVISLPYAGAQEDRPQIIPGERKVARKKDAGPRAVAVLQLAPNGKASLVPIAILVNGKFWDASAYKADPVPMALDPGNVYEVEQAGSSQGLFTVNNALHSNAQNTAAPWLGTGQWRPAGTEEPAKVAHADIAPVGLNKEDAPPRLTHDVTKQNAPATTSSSGSSSSSSSSSPPASSKPNESSGSGDEPPRLNKPSAPATAPPDTPPQNQPSAPSPSAQQGDPKAKDAKPDQANVAASDSGTNEANRPRLRRGKPAESFADEDVPGYTKPGSTATSSDKGKIVETAALNSDVKLIPAISDAAGPPPHSFKFEWVKGDEEDRRKQMMDLAITEVRAYLAAHNKTQSAPKPARTAARRKAAQPQPVIENVQMTAYDMWNSNQPIIVMTATAHMPAPPAGTPHSEVESELEYSICLVTYPDIYNNLHKIYSGITDRFHLDVTPRLELVDAVDADGDGRGELLFRETSDLGSGWVIYRPTGDKLWKMFDSLNPE
jgi:hypothetical protein